MVNWGTVYVFRCGSLYKIGYTWGTALQRMAQLQVSSAGKIRLVCEYPTPCPDRIERELHRAFHHCRVHGEWFRLAKGDLKGIMADAQRARTEYVRLQSQLAQEQIANGGWL